MGIAQAETEWILQVDADCRMGPGFIASHLAFAETFKPDLVAGAVSTLRVQGGFLEAFERLDVLSLTGSGAGSFHYRRPLMCSGANLMYRRELYDETRSFDKAGIASGDDMFLLIGARRLGRKLSFNPDPASVVFTAPQSEWSKLLRQRVRWGAKTTRYRMPGIQAIALLVALANLSLVLLPLFALLATGSLAVLLPAALLKLIADFILIRRMSKLSGQDRSLRYYPFAALLYPFYITAIILAMPFRAGNWD